MSLMNWQLLDASVTVWSDTLAADAEYRPMKFVPKVTAFPHLDMLVGVTGVHEIFLDWQMILSSQNVGVGIDDLDEIASEVLPHLWRRHVLPGTEMHTTIRHWGWSQMEQRLVGRSFQSEHGFSVEPMMEGWGFSPLPLEGTVLTIETEDDLVAIAHGQRKRGLDPKDDGKLCPCGGWLIAHTLLVNDGGGVIVSANKVERFEGFEADQAAMEQQR